MNGRRCCCWCTPTRRPRVPRYKDWSIGIERRSSSSRCSGKPRESAQRSDRRVVGFPHSTGGLMTRAIIPAARLVLLLVLVCLPARPALAQNTGVIEGAVADDSGAVLPGA